MQYRELSDCRPCLILCFASLSDEKYYIDTGNHMYTDGTDDSVLKNNQSRVPSENEVKWSKRKKSPPPPPQKKQNIHYSTLLEN